MSTPSEYFEKDESIPDVLDTNFDPVVESAEEYGEIEPSTDVPAPDDTDEVQNPDFVNGAHT